MRNAFKKLAASFLALVVVGAAIWLALIFLDTTYNSNMLIGASFDPENAGSLGLDTVKAFHTVVNEWKFKYIRFPIHWEKVERERGTFDFSESDYYLSEAQKYGVKVMLAVGNKTPRWPECHPPTWATKLSPSERAAELREYISKTVEHYKNNPALEMWQVENEPFLPFGDCEALSVDDLKAEIALVKQIDPKHPTLIADSGELSSWRETGTLADYFGTTLYRVVWSKALGYWKYDWLPALYYRLKLKLAGRSPDTAMVVELQAEPWPPNGALSVTPYREQQKSMNLDRLKKNLDFAHRVNMSRAYLWGAEWWNWLKEKGYNEIPDYINTLNH